MPVLTGIDVLGVQRYVFASNRLRDTVAASWLVQWATARDGALDGSGGDVLQASGGVAILSFPDEARARDFATRYTRRLYDVAPGLEVAVAHRSYSSGGLARAMEQLQIDLAVAKLERVPSSPQLGLSVTASCRITGLPASGCDPQDPTVPLARMVLRWRDSDVRANATSRWDAYLDGDARYAFPAEIDDMGRTRGETSLLGVVHVDGNGVGRRIASWLRQCVEKGRSDDDVRRGVAAWSSALDECGRRALRAVVHRVVAATKQNDQGTWCLVGAVPQLAFQLKSQNDRVLLPLRPVLLGGDDLTFLCDGRIALDLAETALEVFTGDAPSLGRVTACAGVAVVPSHTPFERAYALAEALCNHAKQRRRERNDDGSWIDWHIGAPRPGEGIRELRARAYSHRTAATFLKLTCRPYRLGSGPEDPETWRWLSRNVLGTGANGFRGPRWAQHRNKLKQLAWVVREGPDGVQRAREAWTAAADIPWPSDLDKTNGFFDGVRTPLLDALELLGIHLPLDREAHI
ncbi:MAG: hypothetical protein KatS3mg131_0265 [Candidatus Tectimicrobiota bacterium]|nr:MAG: hypothetical protein KatS3mg131_0265 [Candidatus Tectomicrobia bacterium]